MKKFQTSRGLLTDYALSCGYVERKGKAVEVTLWKEHGVYHVRCYDFQNHQRKFWETFDTLAPARKLFSDTGAI